MQDQLPQIVSASGKDRLQLADIFTDAFLHDPVMNWIIPDTRLYPGFYRMLIDKLFAEHELMFMESEGRGASIWLPPGVAFEIPTGPTQIMLILRLIISKGFGVMKRLDEVTRATARHHPHVPHYYLQSLGARQAHQGRGIGSALLKATLPQCDRDQMPAYLESSAERNVPLYARHGFEVLATETLGPDGPPMWFMLRQPR
jgi:GNAT superfamily N-acetyltransferase